MLYHLDLKTTNTIHIFIIGVVFLLIGILKENTYKGLYILLALLALCIPILMPIPGLRLTYWSMIKALHWLVFLPAILYFSWLGYKLENKKGFSEDTYNIVLFLGIFIILYHSYKLYIRVSRTKNISDDHSHSNTHSH